MKAAYYLITDFKNAAEQRVNTHLAALDEYFPEEKYPVQARYRLSAYRKLALLKAWLLRRAARTMDRDESLSGAERMSVRRYLVRLRGRFTEQFARATVKEEEVKD